MYVVIYNYNEQLSRTYNVEPTITIGELKKKFREFNNCANVTNVCAWLGYYKYHVKYPILNNSMTLRDYKIDYEYLHIYMANHWPLNLEYEIFLPP